MVNLDFYEPICEIVLFQLIEALLLIYYSSDGMGRTGVFITAMSEIERVKIEGEVDIFQTVKSMRVQRPNMVSTVVSL